MIRRRFVRTICALAAVSAAVASQARLVSDRSQGARRICVYEVAPGTPRPAARPGERIGSNLRQLWIGVGETCPVSYPRVERARPAAIPSLAVLKGESYERDGKICVYRLGSREYRRRIPAGRICPLTPHF